MKINVGKIQPCHLSCVVAHYPVWQKASIFRLSVKKNAWEQCTYGLQTYAIDNRSTLEYLIPGHVKKDRRLKRGT